ncbi:hypothetical protein AGDE_02531 [Angomonas deanei]|nr:hypothetical protein AGDE_02531 [Angomonas deanei]|eukprot:EPY41393.1 hypothetical protein AGDE_02531 [Angomonas deanei]
MYTFRSAGVGVEGFALLSMLVRGVFQFADFPEALAARLNTSVYPAEPDQDSCSEALAELMAYLLTVHKTTGIPLEIHRSALSDPIVRGLWSAKRSGVRQHRVVLAPLHQCVSRTTESPLDNTSAFRVISAFYAFLAERLPSLDQLDTEGHQLPFMYTKKNFIFAKKDGDEISMPIMEKLKQTAQPFLARDAFVAVSGCGDDFMGVEDLVWTLRKGLLCDRQLLPLLDFTDGCRHDRSQILVNACVADFARCQAQIDSIRNNYRFTRLEELNGLTQSESFAVLSRVELLLSNLAGLFRHDPFPPMKVLEALFPGEEEDEEEETEPQTGDYYYAGAKRLLSFADHFHKLRSQIDKDYSGDQMRKARQEAIIRRQTEKKK